MDMTKSHVTIYGITPQQASDFEFDYSETPDSDLISQLVPNMDNWGGIGWVDLEEYEYDRQNERILLTINTKWAAPVEWLQHASQAAHYFENRLMVMSTVQKDETCVTGVAIMDGEILQNKQVFEITSEEVGKYYNDSDDAGYDLEDLDNKIWHSITQFVNVCEQFYLEKDNEDDD
jgi:hypothetical protein